MFISDITKQIRLASSMGETEIKLFLFEPQYVSLVLNYVSDSDDTTLHDIIGDLKIDGVTGINLDVYQSKETNNYRLTISWTLVVPKYCYFIRSTSTASPDDYIVAENEHQAYKCYRAKHKLGIVQSLYIVHKLSEADLELILDKVTNPKAFEYED